MTRGVRPNAHIETTRVMPSVSVVKASPRFHGRPSQRGRLPGGASRCKNHANRMEPSTSTGARTKAKSKLVASPMAVW